MYNFFGYFLSVLILVFGALILWFVLYFIQEKKLLSQNKEH